MKCKDCGRTMALVMTDRTTGRWLNCKGEVVEKAWVCRCQQHCVSGPMHGSPVWSPALTLMPSASVCHAAISGALRLLDLRR